MARLRSPTAQWQLVRSTGQNLNPFTGTCNSDPGLFGVATKNILEYFVSEFLGGPKNKGRSKVHFILIEFLIIIRSADDKC